MSHPLIWPPVEMFYPIGNTPAFCLTQDLAPEQDADILLLGCGDARNVLYTVYADLKVGRGASRNINITCADWEPAVLARNILLYTLLADDQPIDTVWNIFYHFSIDDGSLEVLVNQCRKLVDASSSLETWTSSPFGRIHKMCSSLTLSELRRHWLSYASFPALSPARKKQLDQEREKIVNEQRVKGQGGVYLSISRSAGMFWGQAADPVNKLFHRYWDSGTMFESPKDIKSARNMNPTFAYSIAGEKFIPHYASFPPQAFHLSSAFAPVITGHSPGASPKSIMSTVREQFGSWCSAFKTATKEHSSLTLHYCVGDALSVSHALSHRQADPESPASFALTDWSMKALDLDGDVGPTTFEVIDTSNLMDHLGLLNLLVATKPLLRAKATATLYTEGLLPFGDDPAASLLERLCGDVPTMSSLLGLAPRGLLSGFSTQSTAHEIVYNQEADKQFHERFAWCRPTCDATTPPEFGLTFATRDLSRFIFNVYDRMLDVERTDMMMRKPKTLTSIAHYNRASFAYVLHSIRSRTKVTQAEWDTAMHDFHDFVSSDQTRIIGANLLQDLWLQLHLHGLYTTPVLSPSWKIHAVQYKDPNNDIFKEWKTVPPVVCVILVIPRSAYASILEDLDIRTIPMHVHTLHNHRTGRSSNHFSCNLQVAPGRIDVMQGHPPTVLIEEDTQGGAAGLRGSQSLIVSFLMPSWLLTMPGTTVALAFGASVSSSMKLMRHLGMHQELFSASVTDKKHVHILPHRPNVQKELESFVLPLHPTTKTSAITYMAQMDASCRAISTITARVDLTTKYANALSQDLDISSQHLSPCSVRLDVAGEPTTLIFPYPIKGEDRKLRIARKSRYIEIVVPLSPVQRGTTTGGYVLNPYPIVDFPHPTPWSMHNIRLDHLPILNTQASKVKLEWVYLLCSLQFSDRERKIHIAFSASEYPASEVLVSIKDTLNLILSQVVGVTPSGTPPVKPVRVFQLQAPELGVFTILFVTNLHLDPASFTVVADVAAVPLDSRIINDIGPGIQALMSGLRSTSAQNVVLSKTEALAWKQLLPAFVERCRTWPHGPTCEYGARGGAIPLMNGLDFAREISLAPICACGRGQGLPDTIPGVPADAWRRLRPFATRAAISPLFAVSYVDRVAADFGKKVKEGLKAKNPDPVATRRTPGSDGCSACGGPGKPKLLLCSRCKSTKYCSKQCSAADWNSHKAMCTAR